MGKPGKWLRSFLTGKKDKEKEKGTSNQNSTPSIENPVTPISIPPTTAKEKRRWSFRRSSATAAAPKDSNYTEPTATTQPAAVQDTFDSENEQKMHAIAVANKEAKAIKIQSVFRSYLENERVMEENIKIVEMDVGESKGCVKSRNSYSHHPQTDRAEHRFSTHSVPNHAFSKQENYQVSPAPSALTDMSPRACSGHFEDYSFSTAQSSPQDYSTVSKPDPSTIPFAFPRPEYAESLSYDHPLFPNYMANTESSRAKVRSHSAPKQRPDSFERQPSRRKVSIEGRNVPRAVRMQRSSSHVGATAQNYQYPWSVKLDRSSVSLKDSECESNSTMLTNTNYCRSLVGFEVHRNRY
ncbi:hypothetical protein NC651_024176 [Populus alba x Populus x berolinensis]|nr:hypothetical protein NC651_024176 [Populus alba x Populus x berolinensis]